MGIKYLKSPTVFIFSRRKEIEDDFELLFNLFLVLSYIFKIYLCGGRRFQVRAEISTRQRNSSSRPRQLIYTYFPRVIMIFSFSIIQSSIFFTKTASLLSLAKSSPLVKPILEAWQCPIPPHQLILDLEKTT